MPPPSSPALLLLMVVLMNEPLPVFGLFTAKSQTPPPSSPAPIAVNGAALDQQVVASKVDPAALIAGGIIMDGAFGDRQIPRWGCRAVREIDTTAIGLGRPIVADDAVEDGHVARGGASVVEPAAIIRGEIAVDGDAFESHIATAVVEKAAAAVPGRVLVDCAARVMFTSPEPATKPPPAPPAAMLPSMAKSARSMSVASSA